MIERITMDMQTHHLLMEGGLRPVHQRLSYASGEFQDLLHAAFGSLLPRIKKDEEGHYYHEHFDEESRETTSISRAIAPGEAWPPHEVRRLLDGWKKLRELAAGVQDPRLQAMAFGLQLPDPAVDGRCYRVYRDVHGLIRMHILHGFSHTNARHAYLAETLFDRLTVHQICAGRPPQPAARQTSQHTRPAREAAATPQPLLQQVIPAYLSVACVLALSAVFLAVFFTTIPELVRRQAQMSDIEAKAIVEPLKAPKS
jgi:hypothetical protein